MNDTTHNTTEEKYPDRDTIYMVIYTTWIDADFGAEPIKTRAGPFDSKETAQYWIDNNDHEYADRPLHGYPEPTIQTHPVRTIDDLK